MTPNYDWWRGAIIYQIYPRSFADSNSDGVGDLPGITDKLDYVASLGVDGIWISPFFTSPMADFGYDVSDYRDIDPLFGTLADFDKLVEKAHSLGLKIIIDQVLSHSSDQHAWFKESRSSRDNPKADWYVWADPRPDGTPPNNWLSIFGGSAWEWDSKRQQYYLHHFLSSQPDINFHNTEVRKELLDVMEFWLKRGVDGFRLDAVNFFYNDKDLRDNPANDGPAPNNVPASNPYARQKHIYDITQPENLTYMEEIRALMDRYGATTTVGEIGDDNPLKTMAEYTEGGNRLHMVYSFDLLADTFSPAFIRDTVETLNNNIGDGWPCWAFSNHDVTRAVTRWEKDAPAELHDERAKLLLVLLTTLKGSVCLYQGEELGPAGSRHSI